MTAEAGEALGAWHELYVYLGTGAVTLIGAMFVVASIGVGFLTRERASDIRAFLTPTVVHLSTVFFVCALALVPNLRPSLLAALLALGGLGGIAASLRIGLHVRHRRLGLEDRLWYAATPLLGYAAMLAAAALAALGRAAAGAALALALALLLAAGIRNAWDMILFLVAQPRNQG